MNRAMRFLLGGPVLFGLLLFASPAARAQQTAAQAPDPLAHLSPKEREMVIAFRERAKDYSKLRESIEMKMPKLAKESTPEQIQAHKTEFEERVRAARAGAKRGELFTPDIANFIRATIKAEYKGAERKELRQTVLGADTKSVPMRVNYPYPETDEFVEMSPTLLLKLPQLPKQLRYRFVGRNLLLVDRENNLIVDYMTGALP